MSQRNQGIISGIEGTVTIHSDVDATTSAILLNNWTAIIAPAVTDDSAAGYAIGSEWTDVTADKSYKLVNATVGAAVWKEITVAGDGDLVSTNNLSDVADSATSLSNLGGQPLITQNTAFNKDFGTTAGTVLEGDTIIPTTVFTPTINSTNMVEVSQESDFGTPSVGVITLTPNTTYFVRGNVAITNELLVSSGNAIVGFNRDIDKLTYSGSTNLITVVDNDFSIRNIGLCSTNATGKLLDATNITVATPNYYGRTKVLELQNLKIEDTTNIWTIRGFELVDLSNCLFWFISDGTIGCQFQSCRHLEISSCEFYNWYNRATPSTLDFYRQIEILPNFTTGATAGNGVININASIIHPELDQIGLYVEPTSTAGFGTIASNTFTDTNLTPNTHQETVTLTGTTGTANILIDRFQNYLATFDTSLTTTATNFVTAYGQELAFRFGITVTSLGADLIFTASQAGNIFSVTSTTNVSGDLAGTGIINTEIDGVLSNINYNSQNSYIIQANQGLQNAGAKGGIIIQGNTAALNTPTSYQVLNATNVVGGFTTSPYFPQGIKVITDRDACTITYNQKVAGSFFVSVNATVDGTNGFVTARLRFTRGGVTTSLPFASGTVEIKGAAEILSFTTLGQAEFGDIFDIEFISTGATLTVTDYSLNGYQF